jgi:hypothetical protein
LNHPNIQENENGNEKVSRKNVIKISVSFFLGFILFFFQDYELAREMCVDLGVTI